MNENTNGLLRDYFPRGRDLRAPAELAAVATEPNARPRKTLGWQSPQTQFETFLGRGLRHSERAPGRFALHVGLRDALFDLPGMNVLAVKRVGDALVLRVETDADVGGCRAAGWSRSGMAAASGRWPTRQRSA